MEDGLIIDNGPRNYYKDEIESAIVRMGTPSDTPTPESGGLVIATGINSAVVVQNVIVANTTPTQGAFTFFRGRAVDVTIQNNVAVNITGAGLHLGNSFSRVTSEEYPSYALENNISALNDLGTFGGSGIIVESERNVTITNSIFAMNDNYGVDNAKRAADVVMTNNLIFGNATAYYLEFDLKIDL